MRGNDVVELWRWCRRLEGLGKKQGCFGGTGGGDACLVLLVVIHLQQLGMKGAPKSCSPSSCPGC